MTDLTYASISSLLVVEMVVLGPPISKIWLLADICRLKTIANDLTNDLTRRPYLTPLPDTLTRCLTQRPHPMPHPTPSYMPHASTEQLQSWLVVELARRKDNPSRH
jgi:hypothetical protein